MHQSIMAATIIYGPSGAILLAPNHTTINNHYMQQVYVIKTRKMDLVLLIRLLYQCRIDNDKATTMWLQATMRSAPHGSFLVVLKQ